jgi:flagellar basal-body rod protein FlgB
MITDLVQGGAIPVLEMSVRFAAQRQRLIAHNIANIDTPDFQPRDVSVKDFQKTLARAIEKRRKTGTEQAGGLDWDTTRELTKGVDGELRLEPHTAQGNILFHDRNNRDLERLMQDNVENALEFRTSSELLRSRYDLLRSAISQRA